MGKIILLAGICVFINIMILGIILYGFSVFKKKGQRELDDNKRD